MDYINIVSKEAITAPPEWCFWLTLGISLVILLIGVIIGIKKRFTLTPVMISGGIAIVVELALLLIFVKFCSVPTGNYKYGATVDKETITVSEYEEFIHTYNPEYIDGIYYWTGKEVD